MDPLAGRVFEVPYVQPGVSNLLALRPPPPPPHQLRPTIDTNVPK
jgi:hypothetical protein